MQIFTHSDDKVGQSFNLLINPIVYCGSWLHLAEGSYAFDREICHGSLQHDYWVETRRVDSAIML